MKIGEFAQKHNITQDTVRHYMDLGLLVTEKSGGQYDFSEVDSHDLTQIIELKKLNFSLNEIQKILTIQRISGTNTNTFRTLFTTFLENKKREVDIKLMKYNKFNELLKEKIKEIKSTEIKDVKRFGFPITSLHLLVCPKCQSALKLSEGTIEEDNVMDANLKCSCGYEAVIRNGIFIYEESVRTKMLNGKVMPSKEEYLASSSYEYNNFLYKGMNAMIEIINRCGIEPEYIMEMDNCVGFFLLQYIRYIPKNSVYVLIDYDIERIIKLKHDLEMYYEHNNFIFLCCDYDSLPIKRSSMDILIDYNMSENYEKYTGEILFDKVLPLMKDNGIITGSYYYLGENSSDKIMNQKTLNRYNKNNCIDRFNKYKLKLISTSDIGPVAGGSLFNNELKGINEVRLYQSIYACRKILG